MKYLLMLSMLLLTSCTYNISMAHTEGQATDVIDDNLTNTPTTDLSFPAV